MNSEIQNNFWRKSDVWQNAILTKNKEMIQKQIGFEIFDNQNQNIEQEKFGWDLLIKHSDKNAQTFGTQYYCSLRILKVKANKRPRITVRTWRLGKTTELQTSIAPYYLYVFVDEQENYLHTVFMKKEPLFNFVKNNIENQKYIFENDKDYRTGLYSTQYFSMDLVDVGNNFGRDVCKIF